MVIPTAAITVCMITFNEEEFLPASLTSLVKYFDSFVVTDMGSEDRTLEIASQILGDKLTIARYDRANLLHHGYARARNYCAKFAKTPWVLAVDADEVLISDIDSGAIEVDLAVGGTWAASIERQNLRRSPSGSKPHEVYLTEHHMRLYQRESGIEWSGYIHEVLADRHGVRAQPAKSPMVFEHYSQLRAPDFVEKKREMYFWMMLRAYENPILRGATGEYWYEKFIPENLEAVRLGAREFAQANSHLVGGSLGTQEEQGLSVSAATKSSANPARATQNGAAHMRVFHDIDELIAAIDAGLAARAVDISEGSRLLSQILFAPDPEIIALCDRLDPLSDEYFQVQMSLWTKIAGRNYRAEAEGHETPIQPGVVPTNPHPFHMAPRDVGYWTIIFGHVLQQLDVKKGAKVLEIGYGSAGLTELLVRAGLDVTGVEVRRSNAEYARARVKPFGLGLNTITGDPLSLDLDPGFEAIIFFESFHHLSQFRDALMRLPSLLAPGGKLVFAAEPIVNDDDPVLPFRWGLRMDGAALSAARDVGWVEFGFRRNFFYELIDHCGLSAVERHLPGYHHSHMIIASLRPPNASIDAQQGHAPRGSASTETASNSANSSQQYIHQQPRPRAIASTGPARQQILDLLWRGADPLSGFPASLYAADMQGWNSDHPYLIDTIRLCKPRIIAEVGVWKGASVITMAREIKAAGLDSVLIAIDTWLGSWEHWLDDRWQNELCFEHGYPSLYKKFLKNLHATETLDVVVPLPLDSSNAFHTLRQGSVVLDMVHIDGAHDYDSVISDLRNWWSLLRSGAAFVVDDYYTDGKTWPEVRRAIDDFLAVTPHQDFQHQGGKCRGFKV